MSNSLEDIAEIIMRNLAEDDPLVCLIDNPEDCPQSLMRDGLNLPDDLYILPLLDDDGCVLALVIGHDLPATWDKFCLLVNQSFDPTSSIGEAEATCMGYATKRVARTI